MQPAVQATTRTPGPSTVDPVVNEWRKPMSPVRSAVRTSDSGTSLPRLTRSSYGLFAASDIDSWLMARSPVERSIDYVHLLVAREPDEIDGVAGDANRQARVLLGMIHGIDQRVAIQHVDVHVIPGAAKERVEDTRQIRDAIFRNPPQPRGHQRRRQRNAVRGIAIGNLCH